MDFFGAQDRARKNSRWLVFWFALGVFATIVLVYLAVALSIGRVEPTQAGLEQLKAAAQARTAPLESTLPDLTADLANNLVRQTAKPRRVISQIFWPESGYPTSLWEILWDRERFLWTLLIVGGGIAAASITKIVELSRRGGVGIARDLGGRLVTRSSQSQAERQLLHVVDEMSLAAGIVAPQVFVLDDEMGLNAFAAGFRINDNVVAVTRGLLENLDRDQLQGVIGHEISHIVHGDARLNLRLIGLLHGLLLLALIGRALTRARGKKAGQVVLLGLLLLAIGFVGVFFGRLIKAAISRQREYLADAAAVQYTRNPDGLVGALRKLLLGSSKIESPQAEAASHLFFGSGAGAHRWLNWFDTHPPLADRIARIRRGPIRRREPQPQSGEAKPEGAPRYPSGAQPTAAFAPSAEAALALENEGVASAFSPAGGLAEAQTFLADLPAALSLALQQPLDAALVVYAVLLADAPEARRRQLAAIAKNHAAAEAAKVAAHARWLAEAGPRARLPLLDLALPSLRELSEEDGKRVRACVAQVVQSSGHISPSQFAFAQILKKVLPSTKEKTAARPQTERLDADIRLLLAMLSSADRGDEATRKASYRRGLAVAPLLSASAPDQAEALPSLNPGAVALALDRLAGTAPRFREKLLTACRAVVDYDGKVSLAETELLRAISQSLECPSPLGD